MKSCTQPDVLLPQVRRIRHLSQIILRNLKGPDNVPLDLYYTLSLENEEPFYMSGVIRNTLNPEWAPIRETLWSQNPRLVLKKYLIFRLFSCKESAPPISYLHPDGPSHDQHNDVCLIEKKVSVLDLRLVHTERNSKGDTTDDIQKLPSLPSDSILYRLTDGFYADRTVQQYLEKRKHRVSPYISMDDPQKVNVNSVLTGCEKIFNFQRNIAEVEAEVKQIRDQIAAKVKKASERLCRVRQSQIRVKRLHQLQLMCDKEAKLLTQERERVREIRTKNLIPRIEKLAQHSKVLLQHKKMMHNARKNLKERKKVDLMNIDNEVNERRRDMISALMSIYPIESPERSAKEDDTRFGRMFTKKPDMNANNKDEVKLPGYLNDADVVAEISEANADKKGSALSSRSTNNMSSSPLSSRRIRETSFTIRKIPLPAYGQLTNEDEEDVSTALGFVSHLVCLLSKYLEVPLRYRIVYSASRSGVCDDVLRSALFPLYVRNAEERRFKCGCILLNKNIEHLLNVRFPTWHKHANNAENTLENLDILLRHEVPS